MRYPSRHLAQSSRRRCSCHHGWGSSFCLERKPQKELSWSREQASRNPGFFHHLRRAPITGNRRVVCCFQILFRTPEGITIQWHSLSSGEERAEPYPSLVLTPITGKNSRKDLMVLPLGSCLNHWTITQVIAVFGSISNILDSPLGLHCHICVCNATSSSSQSLCKRGKLLDPTAFLSQSHAPTPS